MSNIRVNAITDEAGTGAPDFPNGYTVAGAAPAGPFSYAAVSGATQALDVGAHNFFDADTLTADTTISFTNVPTEAQWTYTAKAGASEGYTLTSATYASLSKNVISQDSSPYDVAFSSDGTKMFVAGRVNNTVYQYTLSTAWDVSTATYASLSKSVAAQGGSPFGLAFSSDGTKMFVVDGVNTSVYQYNTAIVATLTTPASVQNPPSEVYYADSQVAYTFFTADAGTTVKLINEQVL